MAGVKIRRGYDWGERASRWTGITSQVVEIGGTRVHYLRTDGAPGAQPDALPHLLIHPLGSGSWSWMDVIRPLAAHGAVIAPDLPGAGRTRPADSRDARAERGAEFLEELCRALGLEQVVLHGHSMGALVGALFAARHPERVARLVLTSPPLPGRPDPPRYAPAWRVALALVPRLGRIPMHAGIRLRSGMWRRWRDDPNAPELISAMARMGTDASRISPQLLTLVADEIGRYGVAWRIDGALQAATSAVAALTVDEERVRAELDRIVAPTLVLWGEEDRALPRVIADELAEVHPAWQVQVVPAVGHLMPWEDPDAYVRAVVGWMGGPGAP